MLTHIMNIIGRKLEEFHIRLTFRPTGKVDELRLHLESIGNGGQKFVFAGNDVAIPYNLLREIRILRLGEDSRIFVGHGVMISKTVGK